MRSTRWHHQVNEGKSGLDVEMVRALGALPSLRSKKMLVVEKRRETHGLNNQVKQNWMEDYVNRETTVARHRVEDADTAIKQVQEDMRNADKVG